MSISIHPPVIILVIGIVAMLLLVATTARIRRNKTLRYIRLGVGVAAIAAFLLFAYRPSYIRVDASGISSNAGGTFAIPWSSISQAIYLPSLSDSPYRPAGKLHGIAVGAYRVGSFRTAAKGNARVVSQQAGAALVISSQGETYEFAPADVAQMATEVARHVPVSGWPPTQK